MKTSHSKLIGYWLIESAPEDSSEGAGEVYLRFTDDGLLQWGNENQWRICVISYKFRVENNKILTVCPPNPREEFSPFIFTEDGKLKLFYSNYETIWSRTDKKNFFDSKEIWNPGFLFERQEDYMLLLNQRPRPFEIKRAAYFGIAPQIVVNTGVLWKCWQYSRSEFATFHFEDFKLILEQGVLVNDKDNMDATLLFYLAGDGYIDAVELMLNNGANINHQNLSEKTPLDAAKWKDRMSIIELLRKRGGKFSSELC